jgi:hypothetical protein
MSLVAYLADEQHTDRPRTASSFVRNFAIQLNDGAPTALRQDLKPFAPRIIGTSDGRDLERASLAYRVITGEVWPRAERDAVIGWEDVIHEPRIKGLWSFAGSLRRRNAKPSLTARFHVLRDAHKRGDCIAIGTLAGQLLVELVQRVPTLRQWYWAKALELLDRLCDLGCDERVSIIGSSYGSGSLSRTAHQSMSGTT